MSTPQQVSQSEILSQDLNDQVNFQADGVGVNEVERLKLENIDWQSVMPVNFTERGGINSYIGTPCMLNQSRSGGGSLMTPSSAYVMGQINSYKSNHTRNGNGKNGQYQLQHSGSVNSSVGGPQMMFSQMISQDYPQSSTSSKLKPGAVAVAAAARLNQELKKKSIQGTSIHASSGTPLMNRASTAKHSFRPQQQFMRQSSQESETKLEFQQMENRKALIRAEVAKTSNQFKAIHQAKLQAAAAVGVAHPTSSDAQVPTVETFITLQSPQNKFSQLPRSSMDTFQAQKSRVFFPDQPNESEYNNNTGNSATQWLPKQSLLQRQSQSFLSFDEQNKSNGFITRSPALNRRIQVIREKASKEIKVNDPTKPIIISPQQTQVEYSSYDDAKKNRMHNGKQYRTLVGSMNKQLKVTWKELEELKTMLNGKHIGQVQKILMKLSIIHLEKNAHLKTNANNQIVFDKMMQELCRQRGKTQKRNLAREKVKQQLSNADTKINFVHVPKFDGSWKAGDFFEITRPNIKAYRNSKNQLADYKELLETYTKGQGELLDQMRGDEDDENIYDARNLVESEVDPFFSDPLLREVMCKHLIFRKGNQKIDFFGAREIKKRTIEDILDLYNHPSDRSSDFDSEESFFYLPSNK